MSDRVSDILEKQPTHYSTANLEALTINRLKEIASQLGIKPATDARLKEVSAPY